MHNTWPACDVFFLVFSGAWRFGNMLDNDERSIDNHARRDFVRTAGTLAAGAGLMAMGAPGVRSGAWAAGSDAPEKKEIRVGFIPLTDCSSVVMAVERKFDKKYGIKIIL